MSAPSEAWLIPISSQFSIAVSIQAFVEIAKAEPKATSRAAQGPKTSLITWQNFEIPVLDLEEFVMEKAGANAIPRPARGREPMVSVFKYKVPKENYIAYAGLQIRYDPRLVVVRDEEAEALPPSLSFWQDCAISCFRYKDISVPIVDLSRLFAKGNL